jgi:hypothetical protein
MVRNAASSLKFARTFLTPFATEWLEDVGPFDVALVLLGVNDAAKGLASDFKLHYSIIVSKLAGLSFKPALILGKPLPLLSREFVSSSQIISTSVDEVGRDQGACLLCHGCFVGHYPQVLLSLTLPLGSTAAVLLK